MNLQIGKFTGQKALSSIRRAAFELENAAGYISVKDRPEFLSAYNSLMLILESHMGGVE